MSRWLPTVDTSGQHRYRALTSDEPSHLQSSSQEGSPSEEGKGSSINSHASSSSPQGDSPTRKDWESNSPSTSIAMGRVFPARSSSMTLQEGGSRARRSLSRLLPRRMTAIYLAFFGSVALLVLAFRSGAYERVRWNIASKPADLSTEDPYAMVEASLSSSSFAHRPEHMASLPRRPVPVQSHLELLKDDEKYLEAWIARGEILPGLNLEPYDVIDGVWFWVNGTDPRHHAARDYFAQDPGRTTTPYISLPEQNNKGLNRFLAKFLRPGSEPSAKTEQYQRYRRDWGRPKPVDHLQNTERRFREHDELKYSLRSAKWALGDKLRTSHLISTDFWPNGKPGGGQLENSSSIAAQQMQNARDGLATDIFHIETGLVRFGQLPQWLNVNHPSVRVGDRARLIEPTLETPALRVHHDWSAFTHLQNVDPTSQALPPHDLDPDELLDYKLRVLPTFNSMAAESSLGLNVTDLVDSFFYSNDDNFMGRDMAVSDLVSPLFGPILHINRNYVMRPDEHPIKELGEHPSLRYSAWLLGERFGHRDRHYIIHIQKSHSRPLMLESRLMFGAEFAQTASNRFRGDGRGTNSHMLSHNFLLERHREALLWSYFVARVDINGDGLYSDEELEIALKDLGLPSAIPIWEQAPGKVLFPIRDTLTKQNIATTHQDCGVEAPIVSQYRVSSMDGYALSGISFERVAGSQWPKYHAETGETAHDPEQVSAWIDWAGCWSAEVGRNPIDVFKRMAFEATDCGDFFIAYLVQRSGRKGLSAFLPAKDALFPQVATSINRNETVPHLPLNPKWIDANFDLRAVARRNGWSQGSRRSFSMQLFQRYAYTIADAPTIFDMLVNPTRAKNTFEKITQKMPAFIGINDDMTVRVEKTDEMFRTWMEDTWSTIEAGLSYEK